MHTFKQQYIDVNGALINVKCKGNGIPVLLLHGFPQTHFMWHKLAVKMAKNYSVVLADLRGYGDSIVHNNDLSFRAMANDMIEVMSKLGHQSFHVVAHDRGARVAHRMAMDHTSKVLSLSLMDIIPTIEVWQTMNADLAQRYYHWTFLSQPSPLPETLIASNPILFLHSIFKGLSGSMDYLSPMALKEYERAALKPEVIKSWCNDYRSAANIDIEHDKVDMGTAYNTKCLVIWGSKGAVSTHKNPIAAWQKWFPNAYGGALNCGHFLVEEQPEEVYNLVMKHLAN